MSLLRHPEAQDEAMAAARTYDGKTPGLGDDFVDELEAIYDRIEADPVAFPLAFDAPARRIVREAVTKRFPYRVLYIQRQSDIVVVAVAHARRRPGYWRPR